MQLVHHIRNQPLLHARTRSAVDPYIQEKQRIQQELRVAGVTAFGRVKFASRFLPQILHQGEHIKGVVYGRYVGGTGLLTWAEGMLIATECRVIFLDRKPGFEALDELTYDVVSGVQKTYAWPFASITLHTRIGNYTLRFANKRCIDTFIDYVEKRRLESLKAEDSKKQSEDGTAIVMDDQALNFLNNHDTAVLSTADSAGNLHGAAVHYHVVSDNAIDILTKTESQKVRNIFGHAQVALTIYDQATMQTLQLQGKAVLETDQTIRDRVFKILSLPRVYGQHIETPPVVGLAHGAYTVVRITPHASQLSDFRPKSVAQS